MKINQTNSWYGAKAYAYYAEQIDKANEQYATANKNENIIANITITAVERADEVEN